MSNKTAQVYELPLDCIKSYLKDADWTVINENEKWLVFGGHESSDIAWPKNTLAPDYCVYVDQALNTLSALEGKAPDSIANDILRQDRDVLNTRVSKNVDLTSISLRTAMQIMSGLQKLFVTATDSEERKSKPFYHRSGANPGGVLDEVRFGHTFSGSFGYSVESPVKTQTDMFKPPLQRRVMERIARGLANTEEAAQLQDVQPLVDGYLTGFSANVCDALLGMSDDYNVAIHYSISWSKKILAPEELRTNPSISLRREHFEYLKQASDLLKEIKPEFVTVEGHVINLRSPSNPQSEEDIERKITIKWERDDGTSRNVMVLLTPDEYSEAWSAHWETRMISVNGYIQGSARDLADPSDFKVL